jgi:hypothetical protein
VAIFISRFRERTSFCGILSPRFVVHTWYASPLRGSLKVYDPVRRWFATNTFARVAAVPNFGTINRNAERRTDGEGQECRNPTYIERWDGILLLVSEESKERDEVAANEA